VVVLLPGDYTDSLKQHIDNPDFIRETTLEAAQETDAA